MIGYRKLIAFLFGTACNTLLMAMGVIDSASYAGLGLGLVGGFFGANVMAKGRAAA